VISLLQELESRKEREVRANIEKQEILREINAADKNALTSLENRKKQELQDLVKQREKVRVREDNLLDEIKTMENHIIEQEKRLNFEKT